MAKKKFDQPDMTGVLFKNRKKETAKHPDYTGRVVINGDEYRLAGWIKKGDKGNFLSLAVSEDNYGQTNQKDNQDDVPF
jgi:uncharacterized protein (DUF736 family)